jgi:hypothetical protein
MDPLVILGAGFDTRACRERLGQEGDGSRSRGGFPTVRVAAADRAG